MPILQFVLRKQKRILLAIACCLFFAGCAGSGMRNFGVKPFLNSLDTWPEEYQSNFEQIRTFSGSARLSIESEQFNGNVSLKTNWVRPDRLYLQAEGPLGLDVGKIFIGENRFMVYNQYNNHFTSGSIRDPYLNRFMQTNITLSELRHTVLGYVLEPDSPKQLTNRTHGIFTARSIEDDIDYRYVVNPESGLLETCELSRESRVFLRQDFKNYRNIDGIYLPMIIQITLPDQKERISIFYKSVELNRPLDLAKHTIEISSKVQQLNLN
ncbi:MAG: DUF4292 domain-containing protein [Calditrichia bacterium]